ncbi:MAG: integrase core domain-containing protein [Holophaga sp.]|jgi:transposase InsO family protein
MSATTSPATGQRYGARRVCQVWSVPRSTLYARLQERPAPARRGPKPLVPDPELLDLIQADLAASPFIEEGHRKVWARIRFGQKIKVGQHRVLRVMRENLLLSPHRGPQGEPELHDGRITTGRPNEMWGTDGTKVQVVEEGLVWIFAAVEHWNAEVVGWHVPKVGDRFNALEPVKMGLRKHYGRVAKGIAAGLSVRHDHGCQYTSDHFGRELKLWGIHQSFGFVREPETDGVAERFFKTLKQQVIRGMIYQTLEDLRKAVATFVDHYNREWRVRWRSPQEARAEWLAMAVA